MQGGKLLHVLDNEVSLKPRIYGPGIESTGMTNPIQTQPDGHIGIQNDPFKYLDHEESTTSSSDEPPIPGLNLAKMEKASSSVRYATDRDLGQHNHIALDKFKALAINGEELTEYTIGGFKLDMKVLAEKASEFVPLPPVALPIIFIDKPLNFKHHFFQGLEVLLGREYLEKMVLEKKYSQQDDARLLPAIKQLILSGLLDTDTELTMFVKRVLSGTFGTLPSFLGKNQDEHLIVDANLWGFVYIEPGMKMSDSELRMWISMNYATYKIAWFNAFKGSGVPSFALGGVQDRYESKGDPAIIDIDQGAVHHRVRRPKKHHAETPSGHKPILRKSRLLTY